MRWLTTAALLFCTSSLALAQAAPAAVLVTPEQAVIWAAADLARLTPELAKTTRYLWLPNLNKDARETWWRVLSGTVNGMSRHEDLQPLRVVPAGAGCILALDIADYGWTADIWDKFTIDPTFYTRVKGGADVIKRYRTGEHSRTGERHFFDEETGQWVPARLWTKGETYVVKGTGAGSAVLAPWTTETPAGKAAALLLAKYSRAPIVNARFFFFVTAAQVNAKNVGGPSYAEFNGFKDLQTFFKAVGFREKEDKEFSAALLESVANSGVAIHPRGIEHNQKIGGSIWRTYDFQKGKDPLVLFGEKDGKTVLKPDALELFAHGANGIWRTGLFAGNGTLQDSAPDFVGRDKTSRSNDGRIHNPSSCFRCHDAGGLQDINGWVRNVLNSPPLSLNATDVDKARELRRQYARDLQAPMVRDRERHVTAVLTVTGLKDYRGYVKGLSKLWAESTDAAVDLDFASREIGIPKAKIVQALDGYLKVRGAFENPLLAVFLRPEREAQTISYDVWLEAIGELQLAVRGLVELKK